MVSVIQRARKLQALLGIRLGPGAAVLSPEVTRIHLEFVSGVDIAAKKFWRQTLPRLKYHNPAIPMTVSRTTTQGNPSIMTIHFASASAAASLRPPVNSTASPQTSSAPTSVTKPGAPTERTEVISMKDRTIPDILTELMGLTNGKPVKPTAEEIQLLREAEEFQEKSSHDRERMNEVNAARKKEADILMKARGEVAAMKES